MAASDDLTGHASLGGDWVLESQLGEVEAQTLRAASWFGELASDGDLTVTLAAGPNLAVDHNETGGPNSAHLQVEITNIGTDTLRDVWLFMGDQSAGTIGQYEVTSGYSLTHEGGVDDAARYLGSIAPGETTTQYWLVSYPTDPAVFGSKPDISDDLTLNYDAWVKANDPVDGALEAVESGTATLRASLSASANKIWPNTTSKIPDEYLNAFESQLGWRPDVTSTRDGIALMEGIWYDMGRVTGGIDADGDFIPDHDVWLQPVGDAANYDATAMRLVHSYGVLIVKLNDGTEHVIAFEDELYFKDIPENNTGIVGLVYYEFVGLKEGEAKLSPYQQAASGNDTVKYTGDYGAASGVPVSPVTPNLTFDKTVDTAATNDDRAAIGETYEYTLTTTNTESVAVGNPAYGTPLVVTDEIPSGVDYAGGADANNILPSGASVSVFYSTDGAANVDECRTG